MEPAAKCKDKVAGALDSRMKDIIRLWENYRNGNEDNAGNEVTEELGHFNEYGLSFDYVAARTFEDQDEGYFRYQLSWGGPSEEFRFYTDTAGHLHRVEFWYLDWFDGASVVLSDGYLDTMTEVFEDFKEVGIIEAEFKKACVGL